MEERADDFRTFKKRIDILLHITDETRRDDDPCVEVLYDIFDGEDDFDFDFEHLRLTKDLLLGAALLAKWKGKKVMFCVPTSYYAYQAIPLIKSLKCDENGGFVKIAVPGQFSERTIHITDVICHHGKDYRYAFQKSQMENKRHIIQIFEGEDVPCDTRSLSSLIHGVIF